MLEWSLDALRGVQDVEQIVVALPTEGAEAPAGTIGVPGGAHRAQSVRAALASGAGDPVIVHDAARPLVTAQIVQATLDELASSGCDGVTAAAPVTDTIKQTGEDGVVVRTLQRSSLWSVQTPQVFRREALERALDVADDILAAATDDAWLVERAGGIVRVVPSLPDNIKVTTPGDLRIADLTLRERC
jgi:2-C-methyl-D-erythritol 4-phosphate cytidylyltransferase